VFSWLHYQEHNIPIPVQNHFYDMFIVAKRSADAEPGSDEDVAATLGEAATHSSSSSHTHHQ